MLLARDVDPHRHDAEVIGEVDAVDHEGDEVELGERCGQELRERCLRGLDEAPRDRGAGLARRARLDRGPDGLEADRVTTRRELGEHPLHRHLAEHLGGGEVLIRGDRDFARTVGRAHSGTTDRHLAATESD